MANLHTRTGPSNFTNQSADEILKVSQSILHDLSCDYKQNFFRFFFSYMFLVSLFAICSVKLQSVSNASTRSHMNVHAQAINLEIMMKFLWKIVYAFRTTVEQKIMFAF